MRSDEIRAAGKLAGAAVAGPAVLARDVHRAVAKRTFGVLGVLGLPARLMHDAISTAVYTTVPAAIRAPVLAASGAVARRVRADARSLADSTPGSFVLGALNGAIGDTLGARDPELALELSIHRRGREVVTDSEGLARAFPDAGPKLAVFVHGLCGTEDTWRMLPLGAAPERRRSYGSRLREDLGYTPVYVRYNTGLHISDNGRRLAQVLEHLVQAWPVEVERIALVGHSMGGLVVRSACHYGAAEDHAWTQRLRHVFCLGSPHLGAPLEKAANVGGWALGRLPETRPFAAVVNGRSVGIKDLRFGSCVEDDWCDCDCDELLRDRCHEVPFLPHATYCYVGATLVPDPNGRLATVVGDLLVQLPSASGQGRRRRIPFELDNGLKLGRVNHLQLLNHPAVYEQLRRWLERDPPPAYPALAEISAGAP